MIHIIISAYGEPLSTEQAVNAFLNQRIKEKFKIIVMDPFPDVKKYLEKKFKNIKQFEFFEDPGEGKSFALNYILQRIYSKNKEDIIISTDGDVYTGENSVNEIVKAFKDKKIGAVCGKAVSLNNKRAMTGYWSHISFNEMNNLRQRLSSEGKFFEFSGYLMAFRNGVIKEFPLGSAEDKVIPALFYQKGYKLRYAKCAEVFILNPQNIKDWIHQKKRNIKGQINLKKAMPHSYIKEKEFSLFGEIYNGLKFLPKYLKNPKHIWVIALFILRLYAWMSAYSDIYFKKKKFLDAWREEGQTLSTSPLD